MAEPSERDPDRILSEQLRSELRTIRESTDRIPQLADDVAQLKDDVGEIKADMAVVKEVVKDHSKRLTAVETRVNRLEDAA